MAAKDIAIPGWVGGVNFNVTRGLASGPSPSMFFLVAPRTRLFRAAKSNRLFLVVVRGTVFTTVKKERLFTVKKRTRTFIVIRKGSK